MLYMLENVVGSADDIGGAAGFCAHTANVWHLVGVVLLIFKIVIPIILIVLGMIDLGKAVVSSEDKAVQKAAKTLAFRIVAAIAVFFIPTIVSLVFGAVGAFNDAEEDYKICQLCITAPNSDKQQANGYTCKQYSNCAETANYESCGIK